MVDIVGLSRNTPEYAHVLLCDEKRQIQALDRTQRSLPLFPGRLKTMTPNGQRNGTTTLFFAAIELAEGKVIADSRPPQGQQERIKFLKRFDRHTPKDLDRQLTVENDSTLVHPAVRAWLKKPPRFHLHFTPTSAPRLNVVERWLRDITQDRIRNGAFRGVNELVDALVDDVEHQNADPIRLEWTKKAEVLFAQVTRAKAAFDQGPSPRITTRELWIHPDLAM